MTCGASVCIGAPVRPGASFGTTKAERPLVPGAGPVRANTTYRLGDRRVRDEALRAGEHPVIAAELGPRRDGGGVRARLGLGQREGGNGLAARQRREPALLLGLGAGEEDRVAAQALDREQLLGGRARPGQLLADEAERHRPERALEAAAVGRGHEPREQALATEGPRELPVELVALAPRLGERPEGLGARPAPRRPGAPAPPARGRGRRPGRSGVASRRRRRWRGRRARRTRRTSGGPRRPGTGPAVARACRRRGPRASPA